LTSALILKNLVMCSSLGKRRLKSYESHLATVALSNVESSRTVSQILYEMSEDEPLWKMYLLWTFHLNEGMQNSYITRIIRALRHIQYVSSTMIMRYVVAKHLLQSRHNEHINYRRWQQKYSVKEAEFMVSILSVLLRI